ncbi:MAG: chorismate-binding protein [Microbacteriaceae bacterium]|nr:chorismate-binding protein [Microbacteriaceae bacterium]
MKTPHLEIKIARWRPADAPLRYADPAQPLVWVSERETLIGCGQPALILRAAGAGRFAELAEKWRQVVQAAKVIAGRELAGGGLHAFGAIAFADDSAAVSQLIVPSVILHRAGVEWFITKISVAGEGERDLECEPGTISEQPNDSAAAKKSEITAPEPIAFGAFSGCSFDVSATGKDALDHLEKARTLIAALNQNTLQKIVLARQLHANLHPSSDLRVPVARLAAKYESCATFAVAGLIGASPETLVRTSRNQLFARVLAGTSARHPENPDLDERTRALLETSPQIAAEHHYAAASVVDVLTPLVQEMHHNSEARVIGLPNVWHRATDITATVPAGTSSLDLLTAMHPTAAVAGTPTDKAVAVLAEVEGFDRGYYAGAVGWLDAHGNSEWALALRCAQVAETAADGDLSVTATAGGGLVAGANAETELAETIAKFAPITDAFRPAENKS